MIRQTVDKRWFEHKKYIQKKMKKKFNIVLSDEYMDKILMYTLNHFPTWNDEKKYCGRNRKDGKMTLSLMFVPEIFKYSCKNWHDNLYEMTKKNIITKDLADKMLYCSALKESGYNPFKRYLARAYYRAVKDFVTEIE